GSPRAARSTSSQPLRNPTRKGPANDPFGRRPAHFSEPGCGPRVVRSSPAGPVRSLPPRAPVAQGIEHRPPEAGAQDGLLPGAPTSHLHRWVCPPPPPSPRGPKRGPTVSTVRSMTSRRRVRGNIERLPSGSYRAIVYAGNDPLTGRERRIKRTAKT